jgi:hypothetical protein
MKMAAALSSNTFFVNFSQNIEKKTVSSEARQDILEALKRLEAISTLQKDWDSYGGEAPVETAIFAARKLLAYLNRVQKAAPFFVAPIPDGGVQMEWQGRVSILEVEIAPTGDSFNFLRIVGKGTTNRQSEEKHGLSIDQIVEQIDSVIRE